ncbi:MAG: hypothetical protein SGARI_006162, partial [Bacillariaceae sp.]
MFTTNDAPTTTTPGNVEEGSSEAPAQQPQQQQVQQAAAMTEDELLADWAQTNAAFKPTFTNNPPPQTMTMKQHDEIAAEWAEEKRKLEFKIKRLANYLGNTSEEHAAALLAFEDKVDFLELENAALDKMVESGISEWKQKYETVHEKFKAVEKDNKYYAKKFQQKDQQLADMDVSGAVWNLQNEIRSHKTTEEHLKGELEWYIEQYNTLAKVWQEMDRRYVKEALALQKLGTITRKYKTLKKLFAELMETNKDLGRQLEAGRSDEDTETIQQHEDARCEDAATIQDLRLELQQEKEARLKLEEQLHTRRR